LSILKIEANGRRESRRSTVVVVSLLSHCRAAAVLTDVEMHGEGRIRGPDAQSNWKVIDAYLQRVVLPSRGSQRSEFLLSGLDGQMN
jgi:hypothetical protein